jgi:hypothetical protein
MAALPKANLFRRKNFWVLPTFSENARPFDGLFSAWRVESRFHSAGAGPLQAWRKGSGTAMLRQAVAWMNQHPSHDEELCRLRAEAATLLGITEPPSAKESPTPKR